jgi:hypothetical protein
LSRQHPAQFIALIDGVIHQSDDHVGLMDVGLVDQVIARVVSLGKTCSTVEPAPVIGEPELAAPLRRAQASALMLLQKPGSARA